MSHDDQPVSARNNARLAFFVLQLLLALFFLFFALKPILYSYSTITAYPYQIDREEGFVLNQALQLRHAHTIYPDLKDYPYTMGAYTPLYPLVYAGTLLFVDPGLPPGRALVLLAALGIAVLMTWIIYRETRFLPAALIAPALFLTTYDVNDWIAYARVDFPALLLGLAGFAIVGRGGRKVWLPVSAGLFIAAFYTKQTQLLAPAAALVTLLSVRRWRDAGQFAGITAGGALIVGLLLIAATRGQFWNHTVVYNANEFHASDVWAMIKHVWRFQHWTLLACLVALVPIISRMRAERGTAEYPLRFALLVYTLLSCVSIVGIGKAGSAVNYLLEMDMTLALLLGIGLGDAVTALKSWRNPLCCTIAAGAMTILLGAHAVWMTQPFYGYAAFHPPLTKEMRGPMDSLVLMAMGMKGELLSEDPVISIAAGKPVPYQSFIMSQLAREGKWNPAHFIRDLREKRFSAILTLEDLNTEYFHGFTEAMRDAILENYELKDVILVAGHQKRYLYRPFPATAE